MTSFENLDDCVVEDVAPWLLCSVTSNQLTAGYLPFFWGMNCLSTCNGMISYAIVGIQTFFCITWPGQLISQIVHQDVDLLLPFHFSHLKMRIFSFHPLVFLEREQTT